VKQFSLAVITTALLAACGEKPAEAPPKLVARPFEGQSISVIVPKLDARLIRGPIMDEVESFEARTGAKVRVLTPGWNETIEKIDQSIKSPDAAFDIYVAISMWSGTLLGGDYIEPVPDAIKKKIDWDDVLPIYRNTVLSWNNVAYGLPYDGDSINLYYRQDLFANPEYQARFKKKYKYDLAPPCHLEAVSRHRRVLYRLGLERRWQAGLRHRRQPGQGRHLDAAVLRPGRGARQAPGRPGLLLRSRYAEASH
jgi:ABC-type glycerol-3-phosphate transport system substrate-binding protein